ncbi:MAG: hypothetical protein HFG27_08430 [Provencibacterium sp.]|jgi:hypothetical protein|nr:hypothetical protein [Provencibacterium sp.]
MNIQGITQALVTLNDYPRDKYNVLIPVSTMQVMNDLQKIIVNQVQLDPDPKGADIYLEKSSGKYAITKVGGMKLSAAANISVVSTEKVMTDGCKRCVEMARATGKAQSCGTCPHRQDLATTVSIRVPEPGGGFRIISATREINCEIEKSAMTDAQYKRFYPHRAAIAESKAFMRAIRAALGLAAVYTLEEIKRPFIIAHVVPNLDAPEIRAAVAQGYLQSMGLLFERPAAAALPGREAVPAEHLTDDAPLALEAPDFPEEPAEPAGIEDYAIPADGPPLECADCGKDITQKVFDYSANKYGRPLCFVCQNREKQNGRR